MLLGWGGEWLESLSWIKTGARMSLLHEANLRSEAADKTVSGASASYPRETEDKEKAL